MKSMWLKFLSVVAVIGLGVSVSSAAVYNVSSSSTFKRFSLRTPGFMLALLFATFLLNPSLVFPATIYIDGALPSNCTSGNYSITNRNCTGSNGNAYNNIQSALSASAAGSIIYLRAGNYVSNVSSTLGILIKDGQTWETYPGDLPSKAQVTGASSHVHVIRVDGPDSIVIRNLKIVGGQTDGIRIWNSSNFLVSGNEVTGWNTGNIEYGHGIFAGTYLSNTSVNGVIENNYVHHQGGSQQYSAGIGLSGSNGGSFSNATVRYNLVENVNHGIWADVISGSALFNLQPTQVYDNIVKNAKYYCYHIEAGSTWILRKNICNGAGQAGLLVRPGGSMSGLKIQNNSFFDFGYVGMQIQTDRDTAIVSNSNFDNNIFYSTKNQYPVIVVGVNTSGVTSNTYRNNLIYSSANDQGVCWNRAVGTWWTCEGGTIYADTSTGISQFNNTIATASSNITGNPLLSNPAAGDFRVCEGSGNPVASCTGKSSAIDAGTNVGLPFNGAAPDVGAFESGSVTPSSPSSPPSTTLAIPGKIEVESFNAGGEGVGYHDMTSLNLGGAYRTSEAVDIKLAPGGAGYTIGYIEAGEWLKYDVNVAQSGNYTITLRGANGATTNGTLRIEVDGVNLTGTISIPPTGSYSNETTVTGPTVSLAQGSHSLRIYMEASNFDLNWIEFTSSSVGSAPRAPGNLLVGTQ